MEKEIKKIKNNSLSDNSINKSGIFIVTKNGNMGWFSKTRILYLNETIVCYFPYPSDAMLKEYPYIKTMKENINSISGNIILDLNKSKENLTLFENFFMHRELPKKKLDFKTISINDIHSDYDNKDNLKKFKYCIVLTGKLINPNKKTTEEKWILDFYSENNFKSFKQIHDFIKYPPPPKPILHNNSNIKNLITDPLKISIENNNNPINTNQNNDPSFINKDNNFQQNVPEKNIVNNSSNKQITINNNSAADTGKNHKTKKKNEDSSLIEQSEKILFQEIYFQSLLRVHNFLIVHLNFVNLSSNENDLNNSSNILNNEYENNQNKDIHKTKQKKIEELKFLIKNFTMEIEWLIFETYSLFKNFCLGVSKKLVNEFPVENNSSKIFPLLFPSYDKIKTSKYGAFFYYLSKINVHFTLTWDKAICKNDRKIEKNLPTANIGLNKNEENKKKVNAEEYNVYFNGKWKNLRKEFKNRDFFIDLISFFNLKATKLDKFPCIPMTCIIDYHGFRVYCESIVPKNENNKTFYKNMNNPLNVENYFSNISDRQKFENYFKSMNEFSNDFHNLDTKRKDHIFEIELNDDGEYLNNSGDQGGIDKKKKKKKFDIKSVENLFIANTRNLSNYYNLTIPPKNANSANFSDPLPNEKDTIKLINEKFEKITLSCYSDIQKKIDDYIQILRKTNTHNSNINNNQHQPNFNQRSYSGYYIDETDPNNKKLNFNTNNNNNSKQALDLRFLDNIYENYYENYQDDSKMDNDNLDNSNIIDVNNNQEMKKGKVNNIRSMTNIRNIDNMRNNIFMSHQKIIEDENSLSINENNFDIFGEYDYQNYKFLEDILDPKQMNEENPDKNNKIYINNKNNSFKNKNPNEPSKENLKIYSKIFQTYSKFNKIFDNNFKKSIEYNNSYMNTITHKNIESQKNYIQDDVYIYPMKYNFLLTNFLEDRYSNQSEKEKRENQYMKLPYHYFRPEYLFYHYKLFEDNIELNRNMTEEEKNNKRKLSENFNLFLKEILMHNSSDSKSKNLDEFVSYFNEKHIFYFTKTLDNLYHIPLDSEQLTDIFHRNGINMFCLGKVAEITSVPHIRELCIIEMIARICKRFIQQLLSYRKIAAMNKLYATDKIYDANNNLKKDGNNNNINSGIGQVFSNKDISEFQNKGSISQYLELIPINTYFKFGFPNLHDIENSINPSTKQFFKKFDLDPRNIKTLLTEPYVSESSFNVNLNNTSNTNNNEINLKAYNRVNNLNSSYSQNNNAEEIKDVVKFLNILFNLVTRNSNVNSINNSFNSLNNQGNSNLNNYNLINSNSGQINVNFNINNTNPNAKINSVFNNSIGNPNNQNLNKALGLDEIEIADERLNHDKLWNKIIEEIKRKFFLDNEYILDMIKNKYFSMINLFHSILRNSGIKFIGEPKHICEDMYNFSTFLEFKESVFQIQPKIKGFKFRNFLTNRVYKNTNMNIFDEAYFFDEFKYRSPVKNIVFRNFVENLCYTPSDFTEFSLIFLDSLNKISDKKYPIDAFESIIINTLKKYDKERNIVSAHVNNKGAYGNFNLFKYNLYCKSF